MNREKIRLFFELICRWNRKINLTSIDDEDGFYAKHVDDSLALIPYIEDAKRIIDLGTGAGIPGLILKIARPDIELTLLDSTRKKIAFCSEAARQLGLTTVRCVWGRAEDPVLARSVGKFDAVVSRATWELKKYLKIGGPYVKEGGVLIAMKGKNWQKELEAAGKLKDSRLSLEGTHPYTLKTGEERCLLVFRFRDLGKTP